jgi:predicted DNA-binding antitoxin AbrB/MazE fold protein
MKPIRVRFENGVFKPLEEMEPIQEGTIGEVHVEKMVARRPSIRSSEFFGLWKDRKDIKDGLSYTRKLRRKVRYPHD